MSSYAAESASLSRLEFMMKRLISVAVVLLIEAHTASAACKAIAGADQLWSAQQIRWIFVGEVHGSKETPAAFFDLVCDAVAHGKLVTVALERPVTEQNTLPEVLSAHDLARAEKALLDAPGWKAGFDGRASKAMLQLLVSLRELHTGKAHKVAVSAFDAFEGPYNPREPGARDEALGRALLKMGTDHPDRLILVLTGNLHAMQAPTNGYNLAAMYVPAEKRISLEVTDTATGRTWSQLNQGCGPTENGVRAKSGEKRRGIYLDPTLAPYGKVDGILELGEPLTVSTPANEDAAAECKE